MEGNYEILSRSIKSILLSRQMNYAIVAFGLILFTTGIVFILTARANVIEKDLQLTPNSWRLNIWQDKDFHKIRKVYLMNWTNHKEYFSKHDVPPKFEKIGPFIFKEKYQATNLNFYDDSITFKQNRTWYFVPELSPKNLSTPITNLNFGVMAIAQIFENESDNKTRLVVDFALGKENLIVTKTAGELLFDGYLDRVVKNLKDMKSDRKVPTDRFGWFVGKNNSYEGEFEVSTKNNLNALTHWNGLKYTNYYNGNCGEVKGGLSEIIFTFERSGGRIFVFESDMCGSLPYLFDQMVIVEGLNGYKYKAEVIEYNADSACFCAGNCSVGMLNISSCWNGLPVFMSYPINEDLNETNASDLENYVVVEDVTGMPTEVHKSYQLNLLLKPYSYPIFKALNSSFYVPMVSYQDYWKIDSDLADHLRKVINSSSEFKIYGAVAIVTGVSSWITRGLFSVLSKVRNRRRNDTRTLLNDTLVPED